MVLTCTTSTPILIQAMGVAFNDQDNLAGAVYAAPFQGFTYGAKEPDTAIVIHIEGTISRVSATSFRSHSKYVISQPIPNSGPFTGFSHRRV